MPTGIIRCDIITAWKPITQYQRSSATIRSMMMVGTSSWTTKDLALLSVCRESRFEFLSVFKNSLPAIKRGQRSGIIRFDENVVIEMPQCGLPTWKHVSDSGMEKIREQMSQVRHLRLRMDFRSSGYIDRALRRTSMMATQFPNLKKLELIKWNQFHWCDQLPDMEWMKKLEQKLGEHGRKVGPAYQIPQISFYEDK